MANELTLLGSIEQRIAYHMAGAARECIEIGRCLIEAKALVEDGGWTAWLDKQGIAERQAQRLMKIAREVPEESYLNRLSVSKIGEILSLPDPEQREAVAKRAVEDDMTVKQLRNTVAELQKQMKAVETESRDRLTRSQALLSEEDSARRTVEAENKVLKLKLDELMSAPPAEADIPESVLQELEGLRAENDALQSDLDEQAELRQQAQRELMAYKTGGSGERGSIDIMDAAEQMIGFLGKVGGYTAMTDDIAKLSRSDRNYLINFTEQVESWCGRFKIALGAEVIEGDLW